MTYVDSRYIKCAWESEMRHHERAIAQLRLKLEKLVKELSWELEQHHSRLKELHRLDGEKKLPFRQTGSYPNPSAYQWARARRVSAYAEQTAQQTCE
ncbi:MAG: hypothetical protein D6690_04710 [Nitrospirae bacterium]|nr:MAG: hypothetical protein D6690_04710 [Nitrospirota bacterium]